MRLKIKSNPGSNDFPELKPLPVVGDERDFDQVTSAKLLKLGLAEVVEVAEPIKAVPSPPAIAAPKPVEIKAEPKPLPMPAKAKH